MPVKLPVQLVKKKNKNQSIFRFVCTDALQIDENFSFIGFKVRKFLSFQDISWLVKNTKGQTYSERDVGMRFTAKISNVWAQTK